MGIFSALFGGDDGGVQQVPSSNTTTIKLPAHIEAGGKQLYESAVPLAERPYPQYPIEERLAGFNQDQLNSFDLVRNMVGQATPIVQSGLNSIDLSSGPISQEQIDRYMNPYIENVVDASVAQVVNQAARDRINRNAALANRGSFLNEDRRGVIDAVAEEGTGRTIAELVSNLMASGYSQALQQAGAEKSRYGAAADRYGQYAPLTQQTLLGDAAALGEVGGQRQQLNQALRSMSYEDFLNNFYYPQDQANWLLGILANTPTGRTQITNATQPVATGNTSAARVGGLASLIGAVDSIFG